MNPQKRYNVWFIRENSIRILESRGIGNGGVIVDSMLSADLSDVTTHGIKMFPAYIEKFDKGEFSKENPEITKQTYSYTTIDAKNSAGPISAIKSVNIGINMAKKYGVHTVFSKHCNTFGPAFYYVEKVAEQGLIGFACCNSPAAMPVMNGLETMLGTNPFAFACPSKSKGNILIDMATSIVAKSKFLTAINNGELLPEGLALDKNGNPTQDPREAIKGLVLPMAGPKGYAIALMIDLLTGLLSGASYLSSVGKFYSKDGKAMNVGQMFIVIDPLQIYNGDFLTDMDTYISTIRTSKHQNGKNITIPGDRKYFARINNEKNGIYLDDITVEKLELLFQKRLIQC